MIKNYSSSVPANRSVSHIEDCLASHGAQSVVKQYDNKLISDWVDAQMALVELEQAEIAEIFMPYMWNEKLGRSFYQIAFENKFDLLEAPKTKN